ncbi:hypothetical protein STEG23_014338 [Scotinomys teguina]
MKKTRCSSYRIIFICSLHLTDMVRVSNTLYRIDIEILEKESFYASEPIMTHLYSY